MKKLVLLVFAANMMLMTGQIYAQQGNKETEKTKKEIVVKKNKDASRDSINKKVNTKKETTVKKTEKKGDGTKKTTTTKKTKK